MLRPNDQMTRNITKTQTVFCSNRLKNEEFEWVSSPFDWKNDKLEVIFVGHKFKLTNDNILEYEKVDPLDVANQTLRSDWWILLKRWKTSKKN